ncbi:MAG: TIGR03915 family putative DNA repair protein [Clostridia bacterium]|nr:TIGR03915 family putative DNA repair protein [Clostridia bacterium]
MKCYLYDGSFEGIFCVAYHALKNKETPKIYSKTNYQPSFLLEHTEIDSNEQIFKKVKNALIKISAKTYNYLEIAFKSSNIEKDEVIFNCIIKTILSKQNELENFSNEHFFNLNKIVEAVKYEAHRFLGFIRFSKSEKGVFYACFEPDGDIIDLILNHFLKRFYAIPFVLHDINHGKLYACYKGKTQKFFNIYKKVKISDNYAKLFKTYYDTIFIKSRKNERQMLNYMPKRYHKNMPEKNELL